jgi:hypothetical protein
MQENRKQEILNRRQACYPVQNSPPVSPGVEGSGDGNPGVAFLGNEYDGGDVRAPRPWRFPGTGGGAGATLLAIINYTLNIFTQW